jgi:uncharacterized protein YaeQ
MAILYFCTNGIAVSCKIKLNNIETLEKKISDLKVEQANVMNKYLQISDKQDIVLKEKDILKNKIVSIKHGPSKNFDSQYCKLLELLIEKKEKAIENLTFRLAMHKLSNDMNKIIFNINDAKIELIKAEIKIGKTPKKHLDIAKTINKYNKTRFKQYSVSDIKITEAKMKEKEAHIKLLKVSSELNDKIHEVQKNSNASLSYIVNMNIDVVKLIDKEDKSRLKYKQMKERKIQEELKQIKGRVKFCKNKEKFYKTILKFNIDERILQKFFSY